MSDSSKWSSRFKRFISCLIVVIVTAAVSYVVIFTADTVKMADEMGDSQLLTETNASVESQVVLNLLRAQGYDPDISDLPDVPPGCDSEKFARILNDSIDNKFSSEKVVLNLDHQRIRYIPSNSAVWINENGVTYPVILLRIDRDTVEVSDMTRGVVRYQVKEFERIYHDAGSQSVCIADRGYVV